MELVRQTRFANGKVNRYARGLVVHAYRGQGAVSHSGLWPGYKTEFLPAPGQQVAEIAVSNHGGADLNLLVLRSGRGVGGAPRHVSRIPAA